LHFKTEKSENRKLMMGNQGYQQGQREQKICRQKAIAETHHKGSHGFLDFVV